MSVLNTLCVIPMENECTHTTIVGHFYSNINDVTFEKIHSNFSEDIINLVVKSHKLFPNVNAPKSTSI